MLVLLATWPFWAVNLLIVLFLAISVVMLLTILIQKPQGGGLSAAFGAGASSGQTAFGAKTGDALTIFTIIIFGLYIAFAVLLNWGARITPEDASATPAATGDGATPATGDGKGEQPADGAAPAGTTPANPAATPEAPATTPPAAPVTAPGTETPAGNPGGQPPSPPTTGPGR